MKEDLKDPHYTNFRIKRSAHQSLKVEAAIRGITLVELFDVIAEELSKARGLKSTNGFHPTEAPD